MINNYLKYEKGYEFPKNEYEVKNICEWYNIYNYTINEDMSIDVDASVYLSNKQLLKLPIKFNTVNYDFYCDGNLLNTLDGCPKEIKGNFYCQSNFFRNLNYSTIEKVGGNINCSDSSLATLEFLPNYIGGNIYCYNNNIKSFKGIPDFFKKAIYCSDNPIFELYSLLYCDSRLIYWINEYDVIKGDSIILDRLEEVLIQFDMDISKIDMVKGYNLI